MLTSIRIKTAWTYQCSVKPHRMRSLPAGWVGQLDIEVAAAAIADGVGEARGAMSPELSARVVYYSRVLELHRSGMSLDDAIAATEAESREDATGEVPADEPDDGSASAAETTATDGAASGDVPAAAQPPKAAPRRRKTAA